VQGDANSGKDQHKPDQVVEVGRFLKKEQRQERGQNRHRVEKEAAHPSFNLSHGGVIEGQGKG